MQNKCAEIKIRAERRAGELLKDMKETGEREQQGGDRTKARSQDVILLEPEPKTLDELNITPMQSHRWQTLADMPVNNLKPLPPAFYRS